MTQVKAAGRPLASAAVLSVLCAAGACAQRGVVVSTGPRANVAAAAPDTSDVADMPLASAARPTWWWEHASADHWADRRLHVGGVWENPTAQPLAVRLEFVAFDTTAGTALGSCDAEAVIAPGERAWAHCDAWRGDRRVRGLRVLTRVREVAFAPAAKPVPTEGAGVEVNARFPGELQVQPWARVRAGDGNSLAARGADNGDVSPHLRFALYDRAGVQLATCDAGAVTLVPEVARRVESTSCAPIPRRLGPVARVSIVTLEP